VDLIYPWVKTRGYILCVCLIPIPSALFLPPPEGALLCPPPGRAEGEWAYWKNELGGGISSGLQPKARLRLPPTGSPLLKSIKPRNGQHQRCSHKPHYEDVQVLHAHPSREQCPDSGSAARHPEQGHRCGICPSHLLFRRFSSPFFSLVWYNPC